MLFYFDDDLKFIMEISLKKDIIQHEGKIFVGKTAKDYKFAQSIDSHAFAKRLKDGTYIYQAYSKPKPGQTGTTNHIRRLFGRICLSNGKRENWDNIEALNAWIEKIDQASCKNDIIELICNKYCKKCRMKSKTSCSDVGIDAMTLSYQGYKQ